MTADRLSLHQLIQCLHRVTFSSWCILHEKTVEKESNKFQELCLPLDGLMVETARKPELGIKIHLGRVVEN